MIKPGARKPGARSLADIEEEISMWLLVGLEADPDAVDGPMGFHAELNQRLKLIDSPYAPMHPQDPWPVREILVELLEGHGVAVDG